jgi:hypothetical protein
MKRLLVLPLMGVLLASCGGGSPSTPALPSTVGVWDGTFAVQGTSFASLIFTFEQSNTPNSGDFSGTLTATNTPGSVGFTGNTTQGTLISYDSSGSIVCQGTFTNYVRYDGACVITVGAEKLNVTLAMKKR